MLIDVARKAVETNMVPLWEYEKEEGRIRITYPVEEPLPVQAYLSLIGKYRHLNDEEIAHIQKRTDDNVERLKKFGPDDIPGLGQNAA
jgi:phenylglyoxylate dehydrogenase beta subunit